MNNKQERQRLNELFSDLERLAVSPAGNTPEMRHELESLRARIAELEKHFVECEEGVVGVDDNSVLGSQAQRGQSDKFLLYEKDRIGYDYSNGEVEALQNSGEELPNINTVIT